MLAVIHTCAATAGELNSKTTIDTANCIEFINKLFDSLTSRCLYINNPYNSTLIHSGIVKKTIY